MPEQHFDVLIVGAGISGIGAACHLTRECPGKSYVVLERRQAIGGTWDLFRYPGIRSDSDMYSFAYHFRPWHETKILADGPKIRQYVEDTAAEYGVPQHIRFGRKVLTASWSSAGQRWTVRAEDEATGRTETYTSRYLFGCTGYFNYDGGYRPFFPGEDRFEGTLVHPQHWPQDLDYRGKRVVVIGSGATAVTLVPAMAKDAAHVTMLQRSPTYILALPDTDPVAAAMRRARIPKNVVYRVNRARNIAVQRAFYQFTRRQPALARKAVLGIIRRQVGPGIDMKHFTPRYNPWDQRLCVVPNGDLFRAIRVGSASVVTDRIERFTANGIELGSGEVLLADIIVTATGLDMQMMGGVAVDVDGAPVTTRERVIYKGVLVDGVPNAMVVLGYPNASWTLKADLAAEYFCRLIRHMDAKGYGAVVAVAQPSDRGEESVLGSALTSGYVQRGNAVMPRQGTRRPWKILNDYVRDVPLLRHAPIEDDALRFTAAVPERPTRRAAHAREGSGRR
jgi:cation diffusion facilitator CzcD-associated flavoprotein CzcO